MKPSAFKPARHILSAMLLAASVCVASAQIINIDFLSQRLTGNSGETVASNYVGLGAAGGGDIFNGLLALDNNLLANPSDDITVSGSNLLTSTGGPSAVGFSVADVGADNPPNETEADIGILNGAYLFLDTGENTNTSANFTITGLTSSSVNLFFYSADEAAISVGDPTITLTSGGTLTTYTGAITPFNSVDTIEIANVPVVDGEVSGTFGADHALGIGGLSIEEIPEPSTWAMMLIGSLVLLGRAFARPFRF